MRRAPTLFAAFAALALVLTPAVADARAGSGGSSGSRGGRTYSAPPPTSTAPSAAQPMQRSMTPNQPTAAPMAQGGMMPGAAAQPSRWGGSFAAGLMGGMIGAGIGGLLFGHGFTGGLGSAAGFIGFLFQIALIAGIAFLIMRLVRGRRQAMAGGPAMFEAPQGGSPGSPAAGMAGGAAAPAQVPVQLTQADFGAFEQSLKDVQAAWSRRDLQAMQNVATMEMVSYFADDMAEQQSRGVQNTVSDVRLMKGDLAEAWREGNREFATVAMRFSMIDVTRNAAGHVVDGNPNQPVDVTELWTFVRSSGGRWMLSAIQQTR